MNSIRALTTDLWSVLCAAGLVVIAGVLGGALLRIAAVDPMDRNERRLLQIGIGLGLLSYVPFTLGVLSLLSPAALIALTLCVLLCFLAVARSRPTTVPLPDPPSDPIPRWVWPIATVAGLFLVCTFVQCLTPMVDPDGVSYHVAAPKRWLELGSLRFLPTHLHTQWPMATEMLYLLLYPLAGPNACKSLMALFAILTAGTVYLLGKRLASPSVGLIAASLFLLRAGVPSINTTSVEMPLTLFTTLSALALTHWQSSVKPNDRRWLILAALLAGFACCVKLNGLLIAVLFALVVFSMPRPADKRFRIRCAESALFLVIAIGAAAPWYLRTWLNTGNPVYPFAYNLLDGRHWNREASAVLAAYFRTFNLPPATFAARQAYVMRHLLKLAVLIVVGAALPGPRWTRGLVVMAGLFALIQAAQSDIARFLLPGVPFAAIVIAWWIVRLSTRVPAAAWPVSLAMAAGLSWYALPGAFDGARTAVPVVVGLTPRVEFIRHYVNNHDAFLWANLHLPPEARVLYGPDTRVYYLSRDSYWSSAIFQQDVRYDTPALFVESLRENGIGYLILNRGVAGDPTIQFETNTGWRMNESRRLEEAAAGSEKLWEGNSVTIYRLPANFSIR